MASTTKPYRRNQAYTDIFASYDRAISGYQEYVETEYDESYYEEASVKKENKIRSLPFPKESREPQKQSFSKGLVVRSIIVVATLFITAAVLLSQQESLYSKKRDVNRLKKEIQTLSNSYNACQTELNDSLDLDKVKEVAYYSGLNFAQADQIETVDFSMLPKTKTVSKQAQDEAVLWTPMLTPKRSSEATSVSQAQAMAEQNEAEARALLGLGEEAEEENAEDETASSQKKEKPKDNETSKERKKETERKRETESSASEEQRSQELLDSVPEISDDIPEEETDVFNEVDWE